jgi:hypothetical protein
MRHLWCCWCKIPPTSICPIATRSAARDKSATNADGGFSCKRCWQCVQSCARCWGAWPKNRLCAFPRLRVQIRDYARSEPERLAHEVIEPLMLTVLAQRSGQAPATMTIGAFWREVARLGGYLARSHDGPAFLANHLERLALVANVPGWRSLCFSSPFVMCG